MTAGPPGGSLRVMAKALTKQRRWQLKQIAAGRCRICGVAPLKTKGLCAQHAALHSVATLTDYYRKKKAADT